MDEQQNQSGRLDCVRRLVLCAVIFLGIVSGSGAAQRETPSVGKSGTHVRHGVQREIAAAGVPNLVEVTPRLYRGGQPSEGGFRALAKMGIGIVVDERGESSAREQERELVIRLGMQYVAIPWHCPFPKDRVFARFLSLIRENHEKKIFVHCRLGDDRVGMMIAAYRMAEQGWTADEAMEEMKADGFTFSHHLICPGLARYEKSFPRRYKTSPAFRGLR